MISRIVLGTASGRIKIRKINIRNANIEKLQLKTKQSINKEGKLFVISKRSLTIQAYMIYGFQESTVK